MVAAIYFDGTSSRAWPVTLSVSGSGHGREVVLHDAGRGELRREALSAMRVSERLGRAPRLLTFPDGAYCEVVDHAAFDAMLRATGHRDGWVARAQSSPRHAVMAAAGLLVALAAVYWIVLPWGAGLVARGIPAAVETKLGDATLDSLDHVLTPSRLPAAEQERIRRDFARLKPPDGGLSNYRVLFRHGGPLGANALALPGGTIVVTDELVQLAGTGAGLMGVLAHEAGHVVHRHGLQQMVQASAVGALTAYLLGDYSSLLAGMSGAMLSMRYSRGHEREADLHAMEVMRRNRLPAGALADVLEKLEASHRGGGKGAAPGEDFFSTHPLTKERVEALRGGGE